MNIREYLLADVRSRRTAAISRILFCIGVIVSISWTLYFIVATITIPYQIEYREGASQVMTQILLKGGNPFSLEYQPLGMNNYGIIYSLAVLPFAAWLGNTLAIYRVVTCIFLALSFFLVFRTISGRNKDLILALACSTFILIGFAGRDGLGAFPSAMGSFLFLAAILIPFNRAFDYPGLFLSVLLALLAFYTKPYFVLSFGIVASYLFLFVSKKKGLLYGLSFLLIFALSYLVVRKIFALYFVDTFVSNLDNATRDLSQLYAQLYELGVEFYPSIIVGLLMISLGVTTAYFGRESHKRSLPRFNFLDFEQPLLFAPIDYFAYFLFCSISVFILILGPHIGNYMTFSYQLVVPPFFLLLFQQLKPRTRLALISLPLLLFNMFLLCATLLNPGFLSQKDSAQWAKLYGYLSRSNHILNSPVIASALVERGLLPIDSGQTEYFYGIRSYPGNGVLGPDYHWIQSDRVEYKASILRSVKNAQFDLIVLGKNEWLERFLASDLPQHYALTATITVEMPQVDQAWTIDIWEPTSQGAGAQGYAPEFDMPLVLPESGK